MWFIELVIGPCLVLAGTGLLGCAGRCVWQARRSASWPTVPATVMSAGIATIGAYRTFPSGGVVKQLHLGYAWQVDGRRYEGTRLRFTVWRLGGQTPGEAHAALATAMPGATIPVHVDPLDPASAVVRPEFDQGAVLTAFLLGLLFAGYGLWLLWRGIWGA